MKRKYILITEITLWFFIIYYSIYFFVNAYIRDISKNTYSVCFDNVKGLVKGAPVRLMGINIGYVKDIKISDGKVCVSLFVNKRDINFPNNAVATIEFYGLGGSTSLELQPLISSDNKNGIIPSNAYSVQNYWDGTKLSAETMIETYDSLRLSIDNADLLNNKQLFFQSSLVKDYINKTQKLNKEQAVIINKLKNSTIKRN